MKILIWPNPILKKVSEAVLEPLDLKVLEEMANTMFDAGGVGLSAVQVGIPQNFFLIDFYGNARVYVNPYVTTFVGEPTPMLEGCLSLPGQFELVKRYPSVEVQYQEPDLKEVKTEILSGQQAHCFQHEYEHLQGKLFVDTLPAAKRSLIRGNLQRLKRFGKLK